MNKTFLRTLAVILALTGVVLLALSLRKTVWLEIEGEVQKIQTSALTVNGVLASAGVSLWPEDRVNPEGAAWISTGDTITIDRAASVLLAVDSAQVTFASAERVPARWLDQVGLSVGPHDRLIVDGRKVDPGAVLAEASTYVLQVRRATSITLHNGNESLEFQSAASTVGQALWEAGVRLHAADQLNLPASTPLPAEGGVLELTLVRSRDLVVQVGGQPMTFRSAASTVGEALAEAGLALQGLDYSLPGASAPLPPDGQIRVVRVQEVVLVEETPIPFDNEFQPVPELEIDQQQIIRTGEYGLTAQRLRVRYEDGIEVGRQVEDEWVARQPVNRVVGYGTLIVMHTLDTPDGPIQYWRAVRMWATSYYPAAAGGSRTASGLPLKKGVAAIDRNYVPFYTRMYIPGYGEAVAADVGGGVIGRWIDLGYSDDDWVSWHQWVTVYFLWPPPENIVWIFP